MSNLLKKTTLVALLVFTVVLLMVPYTFARTVAEPLVVEENVTYTNDEENEHTKEEVILWEISFDPGSGSGFMGGDFVESGEEYTLPECTFTAPSGEVFDKWDKGEVGDKITIEEDTVITALWVEEKEEEEPEIEYTITFDAGEGSGEMSGEVVKKGTEYTLPECTFTAPSGEVFDKWDKGEVGEKITIEEDTVITALWVAEEGKEEPETECTITFVAGEGSGEMSGEVVKKGTKYKLPECTFTAPNGKKFSKWDKGSVGTKITIEEDTVLTAQWKNKTTSSGGGSSSTSYKITSKAENATITPDIKAIKRNATQEFKFTANKGYVISDVLVDGKSVGAVNSYKFEKVKSKHTIEVVTTKAIQWKDLDEWASGDMMKANEIGLIPETFAGKDFKKDISREDFCAIAVRLYEALTGTKSPKVPSNPLEDTVDNYVLKAYYLEITKGISSTEFGNGPITREQMATMIARTLAKAGVHTYIDLNSVSNFADDKEMHKWGRPSIYFMSSKEIIKGVGNNKYNPLGKTKIEEALSIALRCYEAFKVEKAK